LQNVCRALKGSQVEIFNFKSQQSPAATPQSIVASPDSVRKDEEIEKLHRIFATQLGEFEIMKKKLMRDLQNRCEKVVELEMALDDTRERVCA
jgi:kinesin family member 5